jgi:hypothetical protein
MKFGEVLTKLDVRSLDEYMRVLELDNVIEFDSRPMAQVEAKEVEARILRDIVEARCGENRFIEDEMWPNEAILNFEWSRNEIVLCMYA